jgi:hypothetical protein
VAAADRVAGVPTVATPEPVEAAAPLGSEEEL